MADKKFGKIKVNTPVSLIIHGGNLLGYNLAKTLIEQGGRAIIVDQYNSRSKKFISELKKLGQADFIDFNGLESLYKSLGRIDYAFYLLNNRLTNQESFTSKDFLEESNYLNATLKAAQKYDAKVALVTTMRLNQELSAYILSSSSSTPLPYSSIELQKYCETLSAEYRDKSKLNTRIIRLGSTIGQGVDEISDPIVSKMVDECIKEMTITIEGEGLDIHYLIDINDAVYGILKLTFSDETDGEVVSLTNNQDYTTLSIAYKLLELNPETAQIKFIPQLQKRPFSLEHYVPAPNAQGFGWTQKVNLETSLIETISTIFPRTGKNITAKPKEIRRSEETIKTEEKSTIIRTPLGEGLEKIGKPAMVISRKIGDSWERFKSNLNPVNISIYLGVLTAVILILNFLLFPIISMVAGGYLTYANSTKALNNLKSFNLQDASDNLSASNEYVRNMTSSFSKLKWAFRLTGQQEFFDATSQLLFSAQYATSGGSDLVSALVPLGEYLEGFTQAVDFQNNIPSGGAEYREKLIELKNNKSRIERGAYDIRLASNLLNNVDTAAFPSFLQDEILQLKDVNNEIYSRLEPAHKIATFLPEILGLDQRARYLVLLQNPAEIRSTGGWLSSYAIISVENGQVREMKVEDVYSMEGQLRIQGKTFPAPNSMQEALDIDTWSMSLSNWDPDLAATSDAAQFFIAQMDPGTTFDGVITIDTEFVKKLLRKWGGVNVVGETEPITAENLDQKIYNLHTEFTPGSTVKATFLANLANETLQRIFSADLEQYSEISEVFIESLNEKHMLVYIKHKDALTYFSSNKWSGLLDSSYSSAPIVVDWNWGANKANAFLVKNHTLSLDILDNENIRYTYELAVENGSSTRIYPQGDYKNYMRIYIPQGASVVQTEGFEGDTDRYNESGYQVVGGWFNVPITSTRVFKITYTVNSAASDQFPVQIGQNSITLPLNIFKQPGTMNDPIKVDITYPESWAAISHEGLVRGVNRLSTQTQLQTDKLFEITWQFK